MKELPNSTFFFLSIFASHSYVLIFSPPAWKQIAVEGCLHGELDEVYASIRHVEKIEDIKIDLLIRCGDFQHVKNSLLGVWCIKLAIATTKISEYELILEVLLWTRSSACSDYIYIGGNHDASNYLWELYYGGWATPNIYFLVFSGVIKFVNIRIGGISGIYKQGHYHLGHFERPPFFRVIFGLYTTYANMM
ncbi:unnamed protein product [Musa acuminata var. zebrina]